MFTRKFYTADHHFGHSNIISHCSRPFASTEAMDAHMIERWNDVVSQHDIVYHLGDFCLGDAEYAAHIFSQLNGRKFLILGNHDLRRGEPVPHIMNLGWEKPPVISLETTDEGHRVFLSHYSHRSWPAQHHGTWHFYGHSHGNLPAFRRSRDVGVDVGDVDFTPRTFKELTREMGDAV